MATMKSLDLDIYYIVKLYSQLDKIKAKQENMYWIVQW